MPYGEARSLFGSSLLILALVVRHPLSEEAATLVKVSLDALVHAAEVFPAVIRMDLYASILHIFTSKSLIMLCLSRMLTRGLRYSWHRCLSDRSSPTVFTNIQEIY